MADRAIEQQRSTQTELEMANNRPTPDEVSPLTGARFRHGRSIGHGSVLIAAITSCTNTSNPCVMLAAGLLAKKAVERGLTVNPLVKTSLAPGFARRHRLPRKTGLQPYLDQLGFNLVGYGCTTCIGNSGPLQPRSKKRSASTISSPLRCFPATAISKRACIKASKRTSSCRRRWWSRSRSPAAWTSI